jgi:DNA repair exonuclease SbcCD ATPase subunit
MPPKKTIVLGAAL